MKLGGFKFNERNKKAADKMLSMYWFAIILIVALGIFSMVYIFYSAPYEVRDFETEILADKIGNCFSQKGLISSRVVSEQTYNLGFDILSECGLTFETENEYDWATEEQFFAEVNVYSVDDLNTPKVSYEEGNMNWKPSCFIKDKKQNEYDKLVKCREERIYAVDSETGQSQYLIKILVGIAKIEKNVRQ